MRQAWILSTSEFRSMNKILSSNIGSDSFRMPFLPNLELLLSTTDPVNGKSLYEPGKHGCVLMSLY